MEPIVCTTSINDASSNLTAVVIIRCYHRTKVDKFLDDLKFITIDRFRSRSVPFASIYFVFDTFTFRPIRAASRFSGVYWSATVSNDLPITSI